MHIVTAGLTVDFARRGIRALDGVDLDIPAGSRVALLGRSGSGKTTLLRALLGGVARTSGTVTLDGVDPCAGADGARRLRRATGVVRQGADLVPGISARTNALLGTTSTWGLADWLRVARGHAPRTWERPLASLAAAHDVAGCLDARASELSGGQRQRIALVRALLPGPRLLLADEPTAGLDRATGGAAVDALLAAGVTVVVATHDLTVARRFPRVLGLRAGRLVHDGPPLDDAAAQVLYAPAETRRPAPSRGMAP